MTDTVLARTAIRLLPVEEPGPRSTRYPRQQTIRWEPQHVDQTISDPEVTVFMTRSAYTECNYFAHSDMQNEVGGWLLGKWRMDRSSRKQFIIVDAILPAQFTINNSSFLTFTQQSQVELRNHLDDHYPDKDLLGWFHTHPRMGIFLSSYDTWLHHHFFPAMHQVALVIEPHSSQGGFFIRQKDGLLDPRKYFGFRELAGYKGTSVVDWINLLPYDCPGFQGGIP